MEQSQSHEHGHKHHDARLTSEGKGSRSASPPPFQLQASPSAPPAEQDGHQNSEDKVLQKRSNKKEFNNAQFLNDVGFPDNVESQNNQQNNGNAHHLRAGQQSGAGLGPEGLKDVILWTFEDLREKKKNFVQVWKDNAKVKDKNENLEFLMGVLTLVLDVVSAGVGGVVGKAFAKQIKSDVVAEVVASGGKKYIEEISKAGHVHLGTKAGGFAGSLRSILQESSHSGLVDQHAAGLNTMVDSETRRIREKFIYWYNKPENKWNKEKLRIYYAALSKTLDEVGTIQHPILTHFTNGYLGLQYKARSNREDKMSDEDPDYKPSVNTWPKHGQITLWGPGGGIGDPANPKDVKIGKVTTKGLNKSLREDLVGLKIKDVAGMVGIRMYGKMGRANAWIRLLRPARKPSVNLPPDLDWRGRRWLACHQDNDNHAWPYGSRPDIIKVVNGGTKLFNAIKEQPIPKVAAG